MNRFLRFLRGVLVAAGAVSVGGGVIALADYAATQGSGTTFGSIVVSAKHYMQMLTCDPATPSQCVAVSAGGAAKVDGSAVTQPVSGTVTATGTVAATQSGTWTVQPGNTANTTAWKVDGSAVTQPVSGTVTANAGTNLNTSALATSAKQPALGTAGSASADVLTVQGIASMTPLLATLSAETTKVIGTVRALGNAGGIFDGPTGAAVPANVLYLGANNGGNLVGLPGDGTSGLWVNIKAGAGSGGTAIADNAAFTQGTTSETPIGCYLINGAYSAITAGHVGVAQCDSTGHLLVSVTSAVGLAQGSTTSGQTGSLVMAAVTAANPTYTTAQTAYASQDVKGNTRVVLGGGIPETISATGTTGATTATLATAAATTTYICGFSIRANATAAATGNATVTGTITGTMNFTQWTAPNASGVGVTEEIFSPCIPASAVNTTIAVVSAAPGTGGVVSVSAWGYQQ